MKILIIRLVISYLIIFTSLAQLTLPGEPIIKDWSIELSYNNQTTPSSKNEEFYIASRNNTKRQLNSKLFLKELIMALMLNSIIIIIAVIYPRKENNLVDLRKKIRSFNIMCFHGSKYKVYHTFA